jgi:hypothetical protein
VPVDRLIRHLVLLALICVMAACAVPVPTPPSTPLPVAQAPKGLADQALDQFDLASILASVDPGAVCQLGGGGGGGTEERVHRSWTVICPRPGRDRTIYFDLRDAIQAELIRIATVEGSSGDSGDATQPISTVWAIRGNAYIGTVRVLGVNGPADITTFVDLDAAIP